MDEQVEITDHIIFGCALARFIWSACKDLYGWHDAPFFFENTHDAPSSVYDWQESFLEGVQRRDYSFLLFFLT